MPCVARLHCQDRALVLRAWRRITPTTPKRLALLAWAFAVLGVDVANAVGVLDLGRAARI